MLLSSYWASKLLPPAALATYFAGHFSLLTGLCLEVFGWAARSSTADNLFSVETISTSILLAVYAVVLVSVGVATRTAINRLTGLGLIGIVILKLYLFDVWQLSRPFQISAFVILGILLLSTSFLYSHFRRLIETWWKMTKLLLSGLAACSLLLADFSASAWHFRRPLQVPVPAPISEFTVDPTLYRDSAANLDDLRILRNNTETPYVILTLSGSRQTLEPPAAILNKAWLPGTGVQAVLDLKSHAEHNRLRIATPLRNFKEVVRVETSDDAHAWAVVQSSGLIFDVSRDDHAVAESTVSYPTSTRRYVRLTIPG